MEILGNFSILSSHQAFYLTKSLKMLFKGANMPSLNVKVLCVYPFGFVFVLIWDAFGSLINSLLPRLVPSSTSANTLELR